MSYGLRENETEARCSAMLRSAFCGPVRQALEDPATIEIMANADGTVWIEQTGRDTRLLGDRLSASDRERVIRLVASSAGASVNRHAPIISAELPGGGERFEGVLPPVSAAPCFSIRKPAISPFALDDHVAAGTLPAELCATLRRAIEARENIVIVGGTSSGKTTFANSLLREAAFERARLVILEDTRELTCRASNLVQLRTQGDAVTLRQLVRSTLRLRPDRIVVGEVRGGEALDLLKAWNTGHPGGLTTLHANSAAGALHRLEQLTAEATTQPPHGLIAEAVDIVVFLSRLDGARQVREALRVHGHEGGGYRATSLMSPSPHLTDMEARHDAA